MSKLTIKVKLVLLFIIIKILPLLVIVYLSYTGIKSLHKYITNSTIYLSDQSKEIILNTANMSIKDSIKNLDKKSQQSLERLTLEIANNISDFLKQRDSDVLFLSKIDLSDKVLNSFYKTRQKDIVIHEKYEYDDFTSTWISTETNQSRILYPKMEILEDNKKEFNYIRPSNIQTKSIPIYKEISFFDLKGKEKFKKSSIDNKKLDVSKRKNTYINSERYFEQIKNLKENEIYVSDVIGEYVGSKIVGMFTKEKASKLGIEFKPKESAYAGMENPQGKRFEGIIRFITPVFKNKKKIGYLSMALDHRHLMEFTDTINPVGIYSKYDISDASAGNYAFLFDSSARNISHARDYFITGFDKKTGERVAPWVSEEIAKNFENSGMKDLNEFLKTYPRFDRQSLKKKSNLKQLKEGKIPVDCGYLNIAPHCHGWMELTKTGGHGSFIIYWSGVWKLVTAASIPYDTGKYKNSSRGFGFVTIGANVDEFHAAANETKENIKRILKKQNALVKGIAEDNTEEIDKQITSMINELIFITGAMVLVVIAIAIGMSNYISSKIENLLIGTQKFAKNEFDYKIDVSSNDEIGNLEKSFNEMASKINKLILEQNELNEHLEETVDEKTKELVIINENLEHRISNEVDKNRQKDAQLIQHSKMASLGEMISMIIHQWKQPLNAISMINSSQELRVAIGKNNEDDLKKDNIAIKKQIELMLVTMNDFRNFFKNNTMSKYNVNIMIEKAINLIQSIYKYQGIFIKYDIQEKDKKLITLGYENEIIQVLINILNNSRDAIAQNESLIKKIEIKLDSKDDDITICIQDFAGGIPENIKKNIFDAYFTTKSEEKGTGLGLYMSKTILKKVNGNIFLENNINKIDNIPYKGVRFTINLKKDLNGKS